MTTLREAAQQALEALEGGGDSWRLIGQAIDALRAALEQPYAEQARRVEQETHGRMRIDPVTGDVSIGTPTEQEQEPVAWLSIDCIGERYLCFSKPLDNDPVQPLYNHPPSREWRGLKEWEVFHVENNVPDSVISDRQWTVYFARAIEAALRSKNHD